MRVTQSRSFEKRIKRFRRHEKKLLDKQIKKILENPAIGQEKKGELRGVYVYKFKVYDTQYLLSYRFKNNTLELIMIGPHENYYRDLSRYMKSRQ